MIRQVFPLLFVLFLFALQIFFHSLYGLAQTFPDLVPIALAIIAVRWRMGTTTVFCFAAGIMEDSFSTSFFGLNALAWVLAGIVGSTIKGSLFGNRLAVGVVLVAVLKLIHEIVYYIVYLWGSPGDMFMSLFFSIIAVFYSAGLALVFFLPLKRLVLESED